MDANQLVPVVRNPLAVIKKEDTQPSSLVMYSPIDPMHYSFTYDCGDNVTIRMDESESEPGRNDFIDAQFEDTVPDSHKVYYAVAAASGAITGALSFIKLSKEQLSSIDEWKEKDWKPIIIYAAQLAGCKKNDYKSASKYLVNQAIKRIKKDETAKEYLTVLTAHPTMAGLVFSLITQFSGKACNVSESGVIGFEKLPGYYYIGKTNAEKIVAAVLYWIFELAANQAESKRNLLDNLRISAELLKKIKAFAHIPFVQKIPENMEQAEASFSDWLRKTISGINPGSYANFGELDNLAVQLMKIALNLGEEAFPVLINECVVRSLYILIRLCDEIKARQVGSFEELKAIPPEEVLPENDRLLSGMCLVASASFACVNLSVAALKALAAAKTGERDFFPAFLSEINIPGICRLVFACVADSKYWGDDLKLILQRKPHSYAEADGVDKSDVEDEAFAPLTLNPAQTRILYCLENLVVKADIKHTEKTEPAQLKLLWLQNWRQNIVTAVKLPPEVENEFFVEDEQLLYDGIYQLAKDRNNYGWFYLLTQELALLKPYFSLGLEQDNEFRKLKLQYEYVTDKFIRKQTIISQAELDKIIAEYKRYTDILTGKTTKTIATIAGGAAVTALTGGLALTFAPGIAALIAGEAVVGLHGAALASASLAFVGGGSLAAGGLGIAGGTAIITGGGALIGFAGSGSTLAAVALMSAPGEYWSRQGAKLLTYSKCTLLGTLRQENELHALLYQVKSAEAQTRTELTSLKEADNDLDKPYIKKMSAYLDCLKKVRTELQKLIK